MQVRLCSGEAQLKILELTAGQVATMYEKAQSARHGPKSLINEARCFGLGTTTTPQDDSTLVREVAGDHIARRVAF